MLRRRVSTIEREKRVSVPKATPIQKELSIVDNLGTLNIQIATIKLQLKRLEAAKVELESQVLATIEGEKEESELKVNGRDFIATVSAVPFKSELIDKAKALVILERIEPGLAFELCKLGLVDLKKYLTDNQYNLVVSTKRSGKRQIKLRRKYKGG